MSRERASSYERKTGYLPVQKFYYLVYEGKITENQYFKYLQKSEYFKGESLIKIIKLEKDSNQTDPKSIRDILLKKKNNPEDIRGNNENNFSDNDEYWMIVDFDKCEKVHNINIQEDIIDVLSKEKNCFMAMSNPCIEIWLLLHLKNLNGYSNENLDKILNNEKINNYKNFIDIELATAIGEVCPEKKGRGYKKRIDPKVFFSSTRIYEAIERAKSLANHEDDYPHGLGSDLYKLVENLVKARD